MVLGGADRQFVSHARKGVPALLFTLLIAHVVRAEEPLPGLDIRRSPLSTDPNAALYLEPAATPGHLARNAGVWGSYVNRLLSLEEASGGEVAVPVRHQIGIDYVASLGLTDRLAFGVLL